MTEHDGYMHDLFPCRGSTTLTDQSLGFIATIKVLQLSFTKE